MAGRSSRCFVGPRVAAILAENVEKWCAHCIIDDWVLEAKSFGLTFDEGLLFPKRDAHGKVKTGLRCVSKDLTETLKKGFRKI